MGLIAFKGKTTGSFSIYQQSSSKNTNKIVKMIFSIVYKAMIFGLIMPAMCPLLYCAFGFPSPKFWFTPFAIENM